MGARTTSSIRSCSSFGTLTTNGVDYIERSIISAHEDAYKVDEDHQGAESSNIAMEVVRSVYKT